MLYDINAALHMALGHTLETAVSIIGVAVLAFLVIWFVIWR